MPKPLTDQDITDFSVMTDSLLVHAASQSELYRKLNTLQKNGRGGWQLLRCPVWIAGRLVAVLVRPRVEER